MTGFFKLLGLVVTKAWFFILIFAVLLTAVSVGFARKLELDTDIMSLLPSRDPEVSDFLTTSKLFGFNDKLIAVIGLDKALGDAPVEEFMDNFARLLGKSPLIEKVEYKLPNLSFDEHAKRLEDKFDIHYAYYSTPGKDSFLMFISPVGPPGDIKFSKKLMKEITWIEREARNLPDGDTIEFDVKYAGGYVIALEESNNMEKNIKASLITSFVCVWLLFLLFFKRMRMLFFVGASLVMAISWSLMAAYFAIGSLNIMTVAFAAILVGLGVDFGIHISNRFLFELSSGKSSRQAVQGAILTTGEGVFFSCATTSLAFYSLLFTGFEGARQFGFLIGTGIILCMLAMLIVLPSLLLMAAAIYTKRKAPVFDTRELQRLARFIGRRGRKIAISLIITLIIMCLYIFPERNMPEFDNRLDNMGSKGNKAFNVQKRILERFGNYYEPISVVAGDKDPEQAVKRLEDIIPRVRDLVDSGVLTKYESIFKYMPSPGKRGYFLEETKKIKNPENALNYLLEDLKNNESKKEEYEFFSQKKDEILLLLKSGFSKEQPPYFKLKSVLPKELFDKFFAEDKKSGMYYSVCYMYPAERIVKPEQIKNLSTFLGIDGTKLTMTGISLLIGRLEYLIKKEIKIITFSIGAALIFILALIYRRTSLVVISVIPMLMSLAATVLVMSAFNIKLNYMNILAFPLIIGMGIDDSIHMLYRYLENNEKNIGMMIKQTGRAVLLTSLTTIAAFGSLAFSGHNGLISLGITAAVGIGFCLLFSLFVLPGLIMFTERKR